MYWRMLQRKTLTLDFLVARCQGHVPDRKLPPPEELVFTVDEEILEAVKRADQLHSSQARDLEVICPHIAEYGKTFVRSFNLHPDSYVQCAFQLAYYRLHGRPAPTYETAMTRQFYHGRTECVRSCTMEAVDWCKAMDDDTVTVEEKRDLMISALKKHVELLDEAKNGNGIDRHLMGLQILAVQKGLPMPELYTDPAYTRCGSGDTFVLDTSNIGHTPCQGAFPPLVPHGYTCSYSIEPNRFTVAMTAWKNNPETSAEKLSESLRQAFTDMKKLLIASSTLSD